jgi:hypothetical protein
VNNLSLLADKKVIHKKMCKGGGARLFWQMPLDWYASNTKIENK